ncbi:hypothetical protein AC578_4361 [Pseudocercospora eumusae]|uniref:Uncharacterized protein n=1 Tax=Pseudocercospora eumusae TaxID=321146 RepID=A0A139H5Z5_9PEZI|nr:hypothetical protein AC578_4361 [Pseudocercospora eumusae]
MTSITDLDNADGDNDIRGAAYQSNGRNLFRNKTALWDGDQRYQDQASPIEAEKDRVGARVMTDLVDDAHGDAGKEVEMNGKDGVEETNDLAEPNKGKRDDQN